MLSAWAMCIVSFSGVQGSKIHYLQEGVINEYAMSYVVPIRANISSVNFHWQSLVRRPVSGLRTGSAKTRQQNHSPEPADSLLCLICETWILGMDMNWIHIGY